MPAALIIAARGKKGHARQALAVAMRLGLQPALAEVADGSALPEPSADAVVVIAAGREAIAPARAIARRRLRPPVAVLQPVRRASDFDLVWAPRHDRGLLPGRADRLETLTAPSAVTAAERAAGGLWLAARIGTAAPVGVLVGGASSSHRFGAAEAEDLACRLAAFADAHAVRLALTTSRRTGAAAGRVLAERLAGGGHLIVDGTAPHASLAYAGIIERARAFIVTSDSVAMLSDAAATGRPIHGWRLPGGKSKFERFYRGLVEHGAMRWFDGALPNWSYAPLDAAAVIADALRPLLLDLPLPDLPLPDLPNAALQHK